MMVSKSSFERFRDFVFRLGGRPFVLILLLGPLSWQALTPNPWPALRDFWFDAVQSAIPRPINPNDLPVRIVAINDPSLESYGQWPWPRTILARLIDRIGAAGGMVVGLDMLFDLPDRLSPDRFAADRGDLDPEIARKLAAMPTNDAVLAASLTRLPVVAGLAGVINGLGGPPLSRLTPITIEGPDPRRGMQRHNGMIGGYDRVHSVASGHGSINQAIDRDGVVRRAPLVIKIGDRLVPSLSVEMLRLFTGSESAVVVAGPLGVTALRLGEGPDAIRLPTEQDGTMFLRHGRTSGLRYVSARDVMEHDANAAELSGKLVLIGFTASGFVDIVATPTAARMNGVEIHAQILETALANDLVRRAPSAEWMESGVTAIGGGLIILATPALGAGLSALLATALVGLCAAAAVAAYAHLGWLIDPSLGLLAITAAWGAMILITLAREALTRREAQRQLAEERLLAAKIEGELAAARAIQMGILPHQFPAFPERAEFDLHALLEPARHVGGDLYDYALIGPNHLFFMIGDVSGKGLPAALFMALAKALSRSCAERSGAMGDAAADVAIAANREISRENASNLFVTAVIGFLDLRDGELAWINAGHDPPFLMSQGQAPLLLEAGGGPPLCAVDDFPYEVERRRLAPGDILLLYTDGVAEATSPDQELYGLARIEALLRSDASTTAKSLIEAVRADVQAFTRDAPPFDDLTLLAIRWIGETT